LTTGKDTYQQFTTYIGKINSLDELQYFFDLGKITDINLVKDRFKAVFVANAEDLFSKNIAMFSNIAINPTSKIDTWQKLKAVAQDDALFESLIGSKIIKLE
jgi:hypothetical protein